MVVEEFGIIFDKVCIIVINILKVLNIGLIVVFLGMDFNVMVVVFVVWEIKDWLIVFVSE